MRLLRWIFCMFAGHVTAGAAEVKYSREGTRTLHCPCTRCGSVVVKVLPWRPAPRRQSPGGSPGTQMRVFRKVGRNQPCPCGSAAKYKNCHGRTA